MDNDLLITRRVTDGWFLGGGPAGVGRSWRGWFQFAFYDDDVFISDRAPQDIALGRFNRRSMDGFDHLKNFFRITNAQ